MARPTAAASDGAGRKPWRPGVASAASTGEKVGDAFPDPATMRRRIILNDFAAPRRQVATSVDAPLHAVAVVTDIFKTSRWKSYVMRLASMVQSDYTSATIVDAVSGGRRMPTPNELQGHVCRTAHFGGTHLLPELEQCFVGAVRVRHPPRAPPAGATTTKRLRPARRSGPPR